jgi:hypothetical protein
MILISVPPPKFVHVSDLLYLRQEIKMYISRLISGDTMLIPSLIKISPVCAVVTMAATNP